MALYNQYVITNASASLKEVSIMFLLNCINIANVHFMLHMGIEVYASTHMSRCINIVLPLFDEA